MKIEHKDSNRLKISDIEIQDYEENAANTEHSDSDFDDDIRDAIRRGTFGSDNPSESMIESTSINTGFKDSLKRVS